MVPGEYFLEEDAIVANAGREVTRLAVRNSGDRPVQVGSHYHFFEVNAALLLDRAQALGKHLNHPAGTSVRFEPGEEKEVDLVPYRGQREVWGHRGMVNGKLTPGALCACAFHVPPTPTCMARPPEIACAWRIRT